VKKILTRIKESLTHNVGIKVIAVVVAALIWLTVVNITDPDITTVIYNVPVEITHEEAISDMDMVYDVQSDKSVNITVSGQRSVISRLSADDFTAIASLKELSKVNSVPIKITARKNSLARKVTIEDQSLQTLLVSVEEVKREQFDIQVEYSGSAAAGYIPDGYELSQSTVKIKAPVSILNTIEKVVAVCELDGNGTDFTQNCKLSLYDSKGNVIKSKHIKMSARKIDVSVAMAQEKEVPIEIGDIGEPADGYEVKSTILSQDKVKLIGSSDVLQSIESIYINRDIDISKMKENYSVTVDLNEYLPDNVKIDGENKVKIEIEIGQMASKSIEIKTNKIEIKNNDNKEVKISGDVKVVLKGQTDKISKINEKNIKAYINVDKLDVGNHSVKLELDLPKGVTLSKDVYVKIEIK
jgi:YbbR domain-containing protein